MSELPTTAPVCARHPDREAYVRCQRCGQPTCPECQRPAAVGIQCVTCVNQAAKTQRSARTIFGGAPTDGRPVATMALIGICVVVYLGQMAIPGFTSSISFVPILGQSEPWRFLTSAFAHGGLTHIAFNMYALWIMGTYLEQMLGRARFVAIYLLSALGGSVMYLLLSIPPSASEIAARQCGMWCTPAVGASGAVFGLFGAFLILQRRLGRSAAGMYAIIGINAVIGFIIPNIAWQAHLGGFLVGMLSAGVVAYLGRAKGPTKPANRSLHWVGFAGILVLLVALTVLKYAVA